MYHQEAGSRSFNVSVEGELVLSEIDLFTEVGSNQPYSYSVDSIQVNDGHLTIELETLIDNGTLSGFAIHSLDGEFMPPPPPEPGIASDENTGADCPVPAFPAASELPSIASLPDPFVGLDGERISTLEEWRCHRQETNLKIQAYEAGAQAGGESRGTGLFFDLYGSDHSASSMTAWAWGISRVIDVIVETEDSIIDGSRLGVTGCSRNGKGALMAGALDERIALTIPQESGAGGAVAWRVAQSLSDDGENVQTLGSAASEQS